MASSPTELRGTQGTGIGDLEIAVAEYVDWYNHRRLHGELGLIPPVEHEELHRADEPARQPAGA